MKIKIILWCVLILFSNFTPTLQNRGLQAADGAPTLRSGQKRVGRDSAPKGQERKEPLRLMARVGSIADKLEAGMPEERLKKHVRVLSGDIGERNFSQHQNLEAAANYIKQEFQDYGYTVQEQVFFIEDKPYRNIIAGRQGKDKKVIIICAHYDSVWGSPGADDNASGIAGLLEIAQLISKDNLNKTIKFIAFTNEEPPFFMTNQMGSLRYAQEARKMDEDIEAVLCLESIGFYSQSRKSQGYPFGLGFFYPDEGDFIGFVSNLGSADLLRKMVREFRKVSHFPLEYLVAPIFLAQAISFSDHWAFWKFGYKAVMITDTAFYRNPHYHTMADTVEKLDYQGMHQVVEGLYGALLSLSK